MIPFLDLSAPYRELQPQIDAAIASGWYNLGPEFVALEPDWAASQRSAHD